MEGEEEAHQVPPRALTPDAQLLSDAIRVSGLSVRRFASEVLTRDARTVWRWLAGSNPLPRAVRERCQQLVATASATDSRSSDV
jgi:hypothetical protein